MARLIDEKRLLLELKKMESEYYASEFEEDNIMGLGVMMAIRKVKDAPTIESEPVRHGEWIDTGIEELDLIYSGYKCSQCGFILCGDSTKYCPGCGSKMDKKSPENHKKYQEEETNKKSFK